METKVLRPLDSNMLANSMQVLVLLAGQLLVGQLLVGQLLAGPPLVGEGALAGEGASVAEDAANDKLNEIRQLIAQLGDEQYLQRQLAETKLLQMGVDAFAELQAAETHSDLEIAIRAKYIVNQIQIEWARPTDSAVVRSIMARFGELPQVSRLSKIAQLSRLDEQGLGALCRIVRFDGSNKVVRYAALAILEKGLLPKERTGVAAALLTGELGEVDAVPLSWIRVYVDQLQAPQQIDARWLGLLDDEIKLLKESSDATDTRIVAELLRCHLKICGQLSDADAIFANCQRRLDVLADSELKLTLGVAEALNWTIENQQWPAAALIEAAYATTIESERLLIYLTAIVRDRQGLAGDAEQLVEQALLLKVGDVITHNYIADQISDLGRHDWAEQEWREVIAEQPPTDMQSLIARHSMALYRVADRGDYQEAAQLLQVAVKAISADPVARKQYQTSRYRLYLNSVNSSREFFLAHHAEAQGDFDKQRRHLDQALRLAPGNADVLIAMYRMKKATDIYRKATLKKIETLRQTMEKDIKQSPDDAQGYNQWAWLVSNTVGDYDLAVERSLRSLELSPGSASYLDTLGRCYYAAGDLDNAIKVQREAVAKYPYLMVMQRQLKLFEDEWKQ